MCKINDTQSQPYITAYHNQGKQMTIKDIIRRVRTLVFDPIILI